MPILTGSAAVRLMCGSHKVARIYCQGDVVYSAGSVVTYHVDTGIAYQEEVDEGASCLSPRTFTPTKAGWTFVGWRQDGAASGSVLGSLVMGDGPVELYAVFRLPVTVSYYNGNATKNTTGGYRYYNNGNVSNPSFALSQAALSGWTARGWSTGTAGNSGITYNNGAAFTRDSDITLYGMYQQTVTLSTVANGATSRANGTRYFNSNGNVVNPTFTVANPSKSGATFKGWSASAGSAAISNSSISGLSLAASATRYAVFRINDVTLSASRAVPVGGGSVSIGNVPAGLYGTVTFSIPGLAASEVPGYYFSGSVGGNNFGSFTPPSSQAHSLGSYSGNAAIYSSNQIFERIFSVLLTGKTVVG